MEKGMLLEAIMWVALCVHPSIYDGYMSARILPVHISSVTKEKIEYRYEDSQQIILGSVFPTERTVFSPKFKKEWDSHKWVIYYCERHYTLYSVKELK